MRARYGTSETVSQTHSVYDELNGREHTVRRALYGHALDASRSK